MTLQTRQPLRYGGVKSTWLDSLPDSGTEMLTISSTGVVSRQAIPVASFGALTGLPSDNAALQSALDAKLNLSGGTLTGQVTGTVFAVPDSANNVPTVRTTFNTTGFGFEGQYGSAINFIHGGTRYYAATDSGFQIADSVPLRFRVLGSTTRGEIWGTSSSQIDVRANSGLRVRLLGGSFTGSKINVQQWDSPDVTGTYIRHDYNGMTFYGCTSPVQQLVFGPGGIKFRANAGIQIRNEADSAAGALACGVLTSQYGATANDIVAISNVGTVAGQSNSEGIKWQLVTASGADSLRLSSTGSVQFNSTANLNTGSIDASIRRNASGPTLDTWSAGGLRVRTADGSAAAPIDASSLTFGSHVRDANGVGLRSQSGYLTFYGFNTNATNDPTMSVQTDGIRVVGKTILGAANYSEAFGSETLKVGGNVLVGGTRLDLFDANSGLWTSGGILLRHGGAGVFVHNGSGAMVRSSDFIGWSSSTLSSASQMAGWFSDATDVISQRRGTNAQTSRLYNTFTSATNGEWLQQQWASNEARIGTAVGSAGGTQRNMVLGAWNSSNTWTAALTIAPTGAITASGAITSGFQTLTANPSTVDITTGLSRIVKNSTSGEVRHWVNDGGTMKSVLFTT